ARRLFCLRSGAERLEPGALSMELGTCATSNIPASILLNGGRMPTSNAKPIRWERRPAELPRGLPPAALRVFAARGYRNATLEEVAAAAGVTKGAVYYHFTNKEQLLARALEHHQQRAFARLEDALQNEKGSVSARLRVLFHSAFGGDDPVR